VKRTMMSLIGVAAALGAVTGVAAVTAPAGGAPEAPRSSSRLPVQRSALLCPAPTSSEVGQTDYTAFAPKGAAAGANGKKGTAQLLPAGTVKDAGGTDSGKGKGKKNAGKNGKGADSAAGQAVAPRDTKPVVPLQEAGKPVTTSTDSPDAPALVGAADGTLAPGWTVQQGEIGRASCRERV